MKTVIDRANTRGHADYGWLNTWHTFSFIIYKIVYCLLNVL